MNLFPFGEGRGKPPGKASYLVWQKIVVFFVVGKSNNVSSGRLLKGKDTKSFFDSGILSLLEHHLHAQLYV